MHTFCFLRTKPRLSQAGALLLPKDFVSLGNKNFTMTKIHFRPYIPNQTVLFPQRIDEDIAENDPVRQPCAPDRFLQYPHQFFFLKELMRILQKTIRCAWLTPWLRA